MYIVGLQITSMEPLKLWCHMLLCFEKHLTTERVAIRAGVDTQGTFKKEQDISNFHQ